MKFRQTGKQSRVDSLAEAAPEGARLFRVVALATSVVVSVFALADFYAGADVRGSIINGVILVTALVALAVSRAGHLQMAFVLFGWGTWGAISSQAALSGSVDSSVLYGYPAVIMLSGWLMGLRHSYAMCAASILAILGLAWMDESGIHIVQLDRGIWGRSADISVVLVISLVIFQRVLKHQQSQTQKMAALNAKLVTTVSELTARELQLTQAESRFSKAGDIVPAPLSLTDAVTGQIIYVNKAWESVLGWAHKEAIGKSPLELGVWFEMSAREAFGDEFRRNGCVRNLEMNVKARDGTILPVAVSADSLEQDGRSVTMSVLFDLSERKLVETNVIKMNAELEARVEQRTLELKNANGELSDAIATLRRTQKELVHSEKMAALGGLVAGVSHELNTPIGNAMTVASSMLDRAYDFQALVQRNELKRSALDRFMADSVEGAELVQRSLLRASDLVHSFKQVAVDQVSERQRVFHLAETIREILVTLSPNLKKLPWRLTIDIPEDIVMDSFPGALGQVTINLVMNAAIHAFSGRDHGAITVTGQQMDAETVELVFADDGVGISPEVAGRIFDPFFTTKLGQGGSGLGLAIVHQMVTQVLQGKVSVESELGRGSRFVLQLARVMAPVNQ